MAIVSGGQIINLPQEDFSGLLGGAGDIFSAVNQVRKQRADREKLENLNRVIQGDILPTNQAGPVRPGITDPRERLNALLGVIPQLQTQSARNTALQTATIQQRAIPTQAKGLVQDAIRTRPDGTKVNVKARPEEIEADPNLDFTEVTVDPANIVVRKDALGRDIRVNKVTGENLGLIETQAAAPGETTTPVSVPGDAAITAEELKRGTGPLSGTLQFFNKVLGGFVPGTIAPKTAEAKQKIGLFNQNLKTRFIANPRFPVAEQNLVKPLLLGDEFFDDPDLNPQRLLTIRDTLENLKQGKQAAIDAGIISADQKKLFTDQINDLNISLNDIPSREELGAKTATVDITPLQVGRMSTGQAQQTLDSLTPEQMAEMPDAVLRALSRKVIQ